MTKSLKEATRQHMDNVSLNEKQLDNLIQLQNNHAGNFENTEKSTIQIKPWYLATAISLAALIFSIVLSTQFLNNGPSYSLIERIANEVASNHLKMKPMEVQTSNIDGIQEYFTKLDFLPQQSQRISTKISIKLAGGRYCSIQGTTAAQLRYRESSGGYLTLFETGYNPILYQNFPNIEKGESPIITHAKGIKVTLWLERGLLMVSTEKPE